MPRTSITDEYCREQAAECAARAATATFEVKEAYLNLEQGWLQLARKVETDSSLLTKREPGHDVRPGPKFSSALRVAAGRFRR